MTITLYPEQEQVVRLVLQSGRYHSASELIDNALNLLQDRERLSSLIPANEAKLRKDIATGIEQSDRIECLPLDMEGIKRKGRKLLEQGTNGEAR